MFRSYRGGQAARLYVINSDGSGLRLATDSVRPEYAGWWLPDGSKIYYSTSVGGRLADPQTGTSSTFSYGSPSWSPNLRYFVYVGAGLRLMRWVGGNPVGPDHALRASEDGIFQIAWAPDSSSVAYVSQTTNIGPAVMALFRVDVTGGAAVRLTPAAWTMPVTLGCCWSPDSQHLASTKIANGAQQLMLVNRDGSGLHVIAEGGFGAPQWSTSGTSIIYAKASGRDVVGIWSTPPDGSSPQQLSAGYDLTPELSPDETEVVFIRQVADGRWQLWVMRVDGTNQRMIDDPPR